MTELRLKQCSLEMEKGAEGPWLGLMAALSLGAGGLGAGLTVAVSSRLTRKGAVVVAVP